ncbi:MAG: hypothetical protein ACMUEL_08595 [Flavobacteriales bacterium Tduv]
MSKNRLVVERIFRSIKRWYGSENTLIQRIISRVDVQHLTEVMAYNLYLPLRSLYAIHKNRCD